ncbi:MAG: hypothetical protein KGY67_01645, partial [Candidatus Thermoplasmatota archaeon]|nr:hypothetical protein [Candidatus Thermoplasmatota archaeon]
MKNNKIMSTLVVLTLLLSSMLVMTTYDVSIVDTAKGTKEDSGTIPVTYILTNNGKVNQSSNLTCGEWVTWAFPSNEFTAGDDYVVKVWNGTTSAGWVQLDVANEEVDEYGNLYINFRVPGWHELSQNPLSNNGTTGWDIRLFEDKSTDVPTQYSTSIAIGNLYYTEMYYKGDMIDHLTYNSSYSQADFQVKIYNWTGIKLELQDDTGDEDFNCTLLKGDFTEEESKDNVNDGSWEVGFQINENDIEFDGNSNPEGEVFYWLLLKNYDDNTLLSNISVPVLLNMTCNYPSNAKWGETININGYILDGNGVGIPSYDFSVYAPNTAGGYDKVYYDDTDFSGYYGASVDTGSLKTACAGTWFVGTYKADDSVPRVNMTDDAPHIPGFIPYASFEVANREDVTVKIENDDDFTTGFDQTINISVENESWMDDFEYRNMYVHVTGISGYNETTGWEYDEDDIVQVAQGCTSYDTDNE